MDTRSLQVKEVRHEECGYERETHRLDDETTSGTKDRAAYDYHSSQNNYITKLYCFSDIENCKKTMRKKVLQTQQRLPNTPSTSSEVHWCFCGFVYDKKYGIARAQTNHTDHGIYIARKMTQKFEEASHPTFSCADFFERGSQVQEGQADHSLSEYDQDKDDHYFVLFWHAVIFAFTPPFVIGLIITFEIRKLIVVKVWNFQKKTSRT